MGPGGSARFGRRLKSRRFLKLSKPDNSLLLHLLQFWLFIPLFAVRLRSSLTLAVNALGMVTLLGGFHRLFRSIVPLRPTRSRKLVQLCKRCVSILPGSTRFRISAYKVRRSSPPIIGPKSRSTSSWRPLSSQITSVCWMEVPTNSWLTPPGEQSSWASCTT